MTAEREKAINEWLGLHCPKCAYNDDRGTDFLNCQAECQVEKDIGIACIHYEEAHDIEPMDKWGDGMHDLISRKEAIDVLDKIFPVDPMRNDYTQGITCGAALAKEYIKQLPPAEPGTKKYEYHYDHTDCIWYRPEARNRCPSTCAQYRDGWNDAMNYIYRDGKGYRPFRRDKQYGE